MTYAAQADMQARFGTDELIQLTDRAGVGAVDATALGQALADADALIDGYLGGRYQVPLSPVPNVIVLTACDIARYYLYGTRVNELVQKRYDNAVAYLTNAAKGIVTLGVDGASQPAAETGGPSFSAPRRVFTDRNLADY